MSAVETTPAPATTPLPPLRATGANLRFLRSELALIFGRRRNQAGLAVLAAVPILLAVALKIAGGDPEGGDFIGAIAGNGMFVALASLVAALPLFLPLAVAAISGDAIAGEANLGTLRYLLTVPVGRTRLLAVKYAAVMIFCAATTLVVAVSGVAIGWLLFPIGDVTLLSGTTVSQWEGIERLLLVCAYLTWCLAGVGAIGLFASTLTEQPIGAMIGVTITMIVAQIAQNITQLHAIHPYLLTTYWLDFAELMRSPVQWHQLTDGLLVSAAYALVFWTAAWARFAGKDVSG